MDSQKCNAKNSTGSCNAERSWGGVQYSDGELQYPCAVGLEVVWWSYFVVLHTCKYIEHSLASG
jgi:hypothetical protein